MMTIRFPNGQAIQYNTANYVTRTTEYSDLYEKKDGRWIAQIPNTCVIESKPACCVYDGLRQAQNSLIVDDIQAIKKDIRKINKKL